MAWLGGPSLVVNYLTAVEFVARLIVDKLNKLGDESVISWD